MKYTEMGYTEAERALANLDKCSTYRGHGVNVHTEYGTFRLCRERSAKSGRRLFTVKGSRVMRNGGLYRIGTLRKRIMDFEQCR